MRCVGSPTRKCEEMYDKYIGMYQRVNIFRLWQTRTPISINDPRHTAYWNGLSIDHISYIWTVPVPYIRYSLVRHTPLHQIVVPAWSLKKNAQQLSLSLRDELHVTLAQFRRRFMWSAARPLSTEMYSFNSCWKPLRTPPLAGATSLRQRYSSLHAHYFVNEAFMHIGRMTELVWPVRALDQWKSARMKFWPITD